MLPHLILVRDPWLASKSLTSVTLARTKKACHLDVLNSIFKRFAASIKYKT